jgi:HEAT repeat protein
VEALAELGDKRAVEPLVSFFSSSNRPTDITVERAIIEALEKSGANKEQIGDAYIKALGNPEYYYVKEAAIALEQMGDKRAILPLIRQLASVRIENVSDIVIILEKLGATKDQITEEYIKELGEHSISNDVWKRWTAVWRRYSAVWILGEYGDKRAIEPLIGLFRYAEYMEYNSNRYDNDELDEFTQAKEALVKLGATKEQIGEACLNALENPVYGIQLRAFYSLIDLCDRRAIEPLMQVELESNFLGNPNHFFDTLEKLGATKEQMMEVAIKGLTSEDKWDRLVSIKKLVDIGDKRVANHIIQLIDNNDEDVRREAVNALEFLS